MSGGGSLLIYFYIIFYSVTGGDFYLGVGIFNIFFKLKEEKKRLPPTKYKISLL